MRKCLKDRAFIKNMQILIVKNSISIIKVLISFHFFTIIARFSPTATYRFNFASRVIKKIFA